ncbi:MAG TPA: hypothetical protein VI546_05100, partial [candidate division Zixibacteria bacterium]|nr:hypothetical protein [candidate division Zixibacteria bacterium]
MAADTVTGAAPAGLPVGVEVADGPATPGFATVGDEVAGGGGMAAETPVTVLDFSTGAGRVTVGAGCPEAGEDGLTTTPVPPPVGTEEAPAEGVLLAGVAVPVFTCGLEIAPVGALSFCSPEAGALLVSSFLPDVGAVPTGTGGPADTEADGVPPGFTVSVIADCLPVVPAGAGATVTLPGLTAVSPVFSEEAITTFEVGGT